MVREERLEGKRGEASATIREDRVNREERST